MHKKLYSYQCFLKNQIVSFFFFLLEKMNANYAKICRVGHLMADFQQSPLGLFFFFFFFF